jgi:hypothetical protein
VDPLVSITSSCPFLRLDNPKLWAEEALSLIGSAVKPNPEAYRNFTLANNEKQILQLVLS